MSRRAALTPSLALLPFFGYLTVFLLVPTITVVVGAFQEGGSFSLTNIEALSVSYTHLTLPTNREV